MEDKKRYKIYKIAMLLILVIFITALLTSLGMYQYLSENKHIVSKIGTISSKSSNKELTNKMSELKELIEKNFLGEIDEENLNDGALKGYIEALEDPYTEYISKADMEEFMQEALGNFVGVGIYMVKDPETNKIMVLSPIKGSPAEKAGILPGDYIISVDGVEYSGDEMTVVSSKIKGEEGSKVTLEILRDTETKTFELTRETIKINSVDGKIIDGNIGYIEFSSFDEGTAEEFKEKFEEINEKGIKSLIIDLRNNGGGIVAEALDIADYILEKGQVIIYEVDKNGKETVEKSKNDPIINMPVIILTNGNTASSSEILAAALKDNGKAKIVGTTTYGKGVIQKLISLTDGSGIKITSAQYLTPSRTKINKIGIEPDEKVELPSTIKDILNIKESEDTQLQKAIEMAK